MVLLLTPLPLDFKHYFELQSQGAALSEWRPVFSLEDVFTRVYFVAFILFSLLLIPLSWIGRNKHPWYILLFLAILLNAFNHNRFIPDAILMGLPLVIIATPSLRFRFSLRPSLLAFLMMAGAIFLSRVYLASYYGVHAGWGVDETHNPLYAARFLKDNNVGGNIFAAYWNTSDFLLCYLHPQVKVAVDIRVPGVYPFDFATRLWYISNEADFRQYVQPLPIDYIVLGRPDPVAFQKHDQGMEEILAHDGYDILYFDRRFAVYRTPQGRSRPEAATMSSYRVLRRWRNDPLVIEKAARETFDDILYDVEMLKRHTIGQDDAYKDVMINLYQQHFLNEEQKQRLENEYAP